MADPAAFASVHVADFRSLAGMLRWRLRARRSLGNPQGLRFAKVLASLGSKDKSGFGAGAPELRRVVIVAAWRAEADLDRFLSSSPLARALDVQTTHAWTVRLAPLSSRGAHRGVNPFPARQAERAELDGPIAVLTLGRSSVRALRRFAYRETPPATQTLFDSAGLVTAISAGLPPTGNVTFSLWESAAEMVRFAYDGPHRQTIDRNRRRPILVDQLNVRFRPLGVEGSWHPGQTPRPDALAALASALR